MSDEQHTITDGNDPKLYERGLTVAHSSDDSGLPDVGLSVGLGNDLMLYVGDVARGKGVGIRIWGRKKDSEIVVGEVTDFEAAKEMVEAIAFALR